MGVVKKLDYYDYISCQGINIYVSLCTCVRLLLQKLLRQSKLINL